MRNRIKYSQNFLRDNELVKRLVNNSSITKNDSVYEIGAGDGIITQALLNKAGWVVSFELDSNFVNKLKNKFKDHGNLELRHEDFLDYALPSQDYKVFSNIPFNITSAIIKKLTLEDNIPTYSYLIVQKEAAMKFAGKPIDNKNSQLSVILYPWFEFSIKHTFKSSDFFPKPNVDIVLLEIKKRDESLIEQNQRMMYEDFITYTFNQPKPSVKDGLDMIFRKNNLERMSKETRFPLNSKPSELNFDRWVELFNEFMSIPVVLQERVKNTFSNQLKQQEKIEPIHRTRIDKNWKRY
jgi:23S rRNA (adenine-N6)-dimethyltransferase